MRVISTDAIVFLIPFPGYICATRYLQRVEVVEVEVDNKDKRSTEAEDKRSE